MTTLEKIEKMRELQNQIHVLEEEIRKEQSNCKHQYPTKPSFDSTFFYPRCLKCGYNKWVLRHYVNISGENFEEELQKEWNHKIRLY